MIVLRLITINCNFINIIYKLSTMPKGKYYEYQIKRSALDNDYLSGNIDDFQYARESLDLDLEYEPYILAQTINSEVAKKQHGGEDA